MTRKPDLDALTVPKGSEPAAPSQGPKTYAHTLSLRLTAEDYRRLRRYIAAEEDRTGRRATHQALIERAIDEYLTRAGA